MQKVSFKYLLLFSLIMGLVGCGPRPQTTPDFSAISSPQVPVVAQTTATATLSDTPTATPTATSTLPAATIAPTETQGPTVFEMAPVTPSATFTPLPPPTDTPTPEPTIPPPPTHTPRPTPKPITPPDPPRQGGSWDMEDGFAVWINPHGDNCSGSQVAVGWQGFTSRGQYGSSCFYLYEYGPNVLTGRYSQEITFDFVDAHAGLYRIIETQPNHQYKVTARLKHVHTLPAMQYHFGYDLTAGTNWQAETVQWTPWTEFNEGDWMTHESSFVATGTQTTIYFKGFHQVATQGGATYIDAIEVIDQGQP